MYEHDSRVVMTLDAGGTNFVFSAMRGGDEIVSPIRLPAVADDLGGCLESLVWGFSQVKQAVGGEPVAISFAFPGPADYGNGIIGDLPNFPAFRGGVALGPFLSQKFGLPVYINNDGNLYAYGEALSGMLPAVNKRLEESGSSKRYSNLIGITLGTGFGAGVVIDGRLLSGDNGCGGDVWLMRNKKYPDLIAEESVSIRAVKRVYAEKSGLDASGLSPKEIFGIAEGTMPGDRRAAVQSFEELGEMAGDAIVRALDIVDGLVVFGGGISGDDQGDEPSGRDLFRAVVPLPAIRNIRPDVSRRDGGVPGGEGQDGEGSLLRSGGPLCLSQENGNRRQFSGGQPCHRARGLFICLVTT